MQTDGMRQKLQQILADAEARSASAAAVAPASAPEPASTPAPASAPASAPVRANGSISATASTVSTTRIEVASPTISASQDAIAIVGLAGEYPGASHLDELWQNLLARRSAIRAHRGERYDARPVWGDPRTESGKTNIQHFGLLEQPFRFDHRFFGISRREAEVMDPHMRLLLETAWACVENAGFAPRALPSQTGVFISFYNHEFGEVLRELTLEPESEVYLGTGTVGAIFANRLSFLLGLTGPSEVYDTACSTALVALHRAVQALRAGDCELALVGGVSLLLTPSRVIDLSKLGILNTGPVCNPYSHPANKENIGEGVGAVLLKPLSRAQQDGDFIYAVVRQSDVNHHGRRSGRLTLPSSDALRDLMRTSLEKCRLQPGELSYIEGHGAGGETDVVELLACDQALKPLVRPGEKIPLGSVKSNLGFGEGSGGMAQLTRCALALHHGRVPATLHFEQADPVFDLEGSALRILSEELPLAPERSHTVSMLAYGLGGTNAHVMLMSPPSPIQTTGRDGVQKPPASAPVPIVLSAAHPEALRSSLERLLNHLEMPSHRRRYRQLLPDEPLLLRAISGTLMARERQQTHRLVMQVSTLSELLATLRQVLAGINVPHVWMSPGLLPGSSVAGSSTETTAPNAHLSAGSALVAAAIAWSKGDNAALKRLSAQVFATEDGSVPTGAAFQKLPLPTAPFWGPALRLPRKQSSPLTSRIQTELEGESHRTRLTLRQADLFIDQHRVDGVPLLPAAGLVALLAQLLPENSGAPSGTQPFTLENLAFLAPLEVADATSILEWNLTPAGVLKVFNGQGQLCAQARLLSAQRGDASPVPQAQLQPSTLLSMQRVAGRAQFWSWFLAPGSKQGHGPSLQALDGIFRERGSSADHPSNHRLIAALQSDGTLGDLSTIALLDSALLACGGFELEAGTTLEAQLPFSMERVTLYRPFPSGERLYALVTRAGERLPRFDLSLEDGLGTVYAQVTGFFTRPLSARNQGTAPSTRSSAPASPGSLPSPERIPTRSEADVMSNSPHAVPSEAPPVGAAATSARPVTPHASMATSPTPGPTLQQRLLHRLRQEVASFLKCRVEEVPEHESLEPLGFDSIAVHALTEQLRERWSVPLPATTFFEYGSLLEVSLALALRFEARLGAVLREGQASDPGLKPSLQVPSTSAAAPTHAVAEPVQVPTLSPVAAPALATAPESTPTAFASGGSLDQPFDVAVVGVGGSFPGAANFHDFWRRIRAGEDLISEMPESRRAGVYRVYAQEVESLGGIFGGFIADADRFDAGFFGYATDEVMAMDPQQRLFLEATWSAIEDAGHAPASLAGQKVGVYVGALGNDYRAYLEDLDYPIAMQFEGTGASLAGIANRTSYFFNFTGPSLVLDTACCSSLYAIDRAVRDLRLGVCDGAIAGGVSFISTATGFHMYRAMEYLSADWRCKTFSEEGDGWSKGELIAAIYLKRYEDAVRDGDPIYGVIRSTGTNHGGKAFFYTQPNTPRHVGLIQEVYRQAGVDAQDLVYIEAHGSGTRIGDALEFNGISRALQELAHTQGRTLPDASCGIGSIKSNMGHAEAAAGVAGLLKALMSLHDEVMPASLHIHNVGSHIVLEGSPLYPVRTLQPLPPRRSPHQRRHGGVHSFNFSGATVHALVAEHRAQSSTSRLPLTRYPVCLSARTPIALKQLCAELAAHLRSLPRSPGLIDAVVSTLCRSRAGLEHRLAFVVADLEALITRLDAASQLNLAAVAAGSPFKVARVEKPRGAFRLLDLSDATVDALIDEWLRHPRFEWETVLKPFGVPRIHLPTYPFDHSVSYFPVPEQVPHPDSAPQRKELQGPASRASAPAPALASTSASASAPAPASAPARESSQEAAEVPAGVLHPSRAGIEARLVQHLAEVLGLPASDIALDWSVSEFGFDSLKLVTLAERLSAEYGVTIQPPELFEHATPAGWVDLVVMRLSKRVSRSKDVSEPQVSAVPPIPAAKTLASPTSQPRPASEVRTESHKEQKAPAATAQAAIAIVGMSGCFPGAANLDEFWRNLRDGVDGITEIPAGRWDWRAVTRPESPDQYATPIKWGGFIQGVDEFDPRFFGITPREALGMDPQQRLLLTYAWRAIEDAGYAPQSLSGSSTGIFVGTADSGYFSLLQAHPEEESFGATGSIPSIGPNRLSYLLNVSGPSEPIETSCSSSLVALHRAVQAILAGDCQQALVAGINTIVTPDNHLAFGKVGMLSPDGRCKTFSDRASGYVRGEGVGVLFLKPLSDAEAAGDTIYGVVRGSAVNHGGRVSSLTTPNPRAQAQVLVQAYARAEVDPRTITFLETHGTGTPLGDPIEIQGLKEAFSQLAQQQGVALPSQAYCALGAVKTHIGHLELAAGIAGVIKVLLQLKHQALASNLHGGRLNPYIELRGSPFYLLHEGRPWTRLQDDEGQALPRRAGVSSFGFGGVNSHVVLEEYVAPARPASVSSPQLILVSARTAEQRNEALQALHEKVASALAQDASEPESAPHLRLEDVAFTLQVGRTAQAHRWGVCVTSLEALEEQLRRHLNAHSTCEAVMGQAGKLEEPWKSLLLDGDVQSLLAEWLKEGREQQLLRLWVQGLNVDWQGLHQRRVEEGKPLPRRVSLPPTPQARERYWPKPAPASTSDAQYTQVAKTGVDGLTYVSRWTLASPLQAEPVKPVMYQGSLEQAPVILVVTVGSAQPLGQAFEQALAQQSPGHRIVWLPLPSPEGVTELRQHLAGLKSVRQVFFFASHARGLTSTGLSDAGSTAAAMPGEMSPHAQERLLLRLVQWLCADAPEDAPAASPIELTIVTQGLFGLDGDATSAWGAGLTGLSFAIAQGESRLRVRMLDLSPAEVSADAASSLSSTLPSALSSALSNAILREPFSERGEPTLLRLGLRHRRELQAVTWGGEPSGLRRHGVYVVVGGAGTVGQALTRGLLQQYQARVIWLGRSPLTAPSVQTALKSLYAEGCDPQYVQADVTDLASLEMALASLQAPFGRIDGFIFAALSFQEDDRIRTTSDATFERVAGTKTRGSVNLLTAVRNLSDAQQHRGESAPDFVVFCSSAQAYGFSGAASLASYACGITFADGLVEAAQSQLPFPVGTLQWGFWRSEQPGSSRLDRHAGALESYEGFEALERFTGALRHGLLHRLICLRASPPVRALMPMSPETRQCVVRAPLPAVSAPVPVSLPSAQGTRMREAAGLLDPWLIQLLLAQLQTLGLFTDDTWATAEQLRQRAGLTAAHPGWWLETLRLLAEAGKLEQRTLADSSHLLQGLSYRRSLAAFGLTPGHERALVNPPQTVWERWRKARMELLSNPMLEAQLRLVEHCLEALPDVLTGRTPAMEVLFPGGSMSRVTPVYREDGLAHHCNQLMASELARLVEGWLSLPTTGSPLPPVRILEVGAGTGGTTSFVLPALRELTTRLGVALPVEVYLYTDVSPAFLRHGELSFGAAYPFVRFSLLNIEAPLEPQGITPGSFDIVLATNALHATRDIRETLRHVHSALRPGGQLLLMEVSDHSIFSQLTFGLLPGWWVMRDPALRIPGSPGLSPAQWQHALRLEGFPHARWPAHEVHALGMQVIVATADGVISRDSNQSVLPERSSFPVQEKPAPQPAPLPSRAQSSTRQAVLETLAWTLSLPVESIETSLAFSELGIDSLLGVTFVGKLGEKLGIKLNAALLYEHGRVDSLSAYLVKVYGEPDTADHNDGETAQVSPAPSNQQPMASLTTTLAAETTVPFSPAAALSAPSLAALPLAGTTLAAPRSQEVIREPMADAVTKAKTDTEQPLRPAFEPIAIIGMAAQAPGAADVHAFWQNLLSHQAQGGKLEGRSHFDPTFFYISPRDAVSMNPHQRLILQEGWHALEDAGINPMSLDGQAVGVFIGAEPSGYHHETFTGGSDALVASRLSYFLNLRGPTLVVNTGCSSSAVALHLAVQSLQSGESTLALAGGVFASLETALVQELSALDMLSDTGVCHTFDAAADGTAFSEGVGVVVLKPLPAALSAGDPIYGVIEGSAMNQDGASNGLTAPNGDAQEALITGLYGRLGLNPARISYVEAHGTGTRLGDPVEAQALIRAFRHFTDRTGFCALGSVKSHIGHTSAASGVLGLITVLLSMRHNSLPGLHGFTSLNPLISLEDSPFYLASAPQNWTGENGPRRAALSSFGHSGTNVHLVVKEAPDRQSGSRKGMGEQSRDTSGRSQRSDGLSQRSDGLSQRSDGLSPWIPLSARTVPALEAQARKLMEVLNAQAALASSGSTDLLTLPSLAFTLQVGRTHFKERLLFRAASLADLCEQLQAFVAAPHSAGLWKRATASRTQASASASAPASSGLTGIVTDKLNPEALADRWLQGESDVWHSYWQAADSIGGQSNSRPARCHLPGYPFQTQSYWKPEPVEETVPEPAQNLKTATRPAHAQGKVTAHEDRLLLLRPEWKPVPAMPAQSSSNFTAPRLVLLGPGTDPMLRPLLLAEGSSCETLSSLTSSPDEHFLQLSLELLEQLQTKMRTQSGPQFVQIALVDQPDARISAYEPLPAQLFEALSGAMLSAMQESPQLTGQVILLPPGLSRAEQQQRLSEAALLRTESQLRWHHADSHRADSHRADSHRADSHRADLHRANGHHFDSAEPEALSHGWHRLTWQELPAPTTREQDVAAHHLLPSHTLWQDNGLYLITGGLGGIGMLFAQALARRTRGSVLMLVGRSVPSAQQQLEVEKLQAMGAQVELVQADISEKAEVQRLFAHLHARYDLRQGRKLHAILHAAGVVKDRLLIQKSRSEAHAVLAPKVPGTLWLDLFSREFEPGMVVLFASGVGVGGQNGQADYAIANAFMDGYAAQRSREQASAHHARGSTRFIAVDWPFWEAGGMQLSASAQKQLEQRLGMSPMPSTDGIRALELALHTDEPQTLVLHGDTARMRTVMQGTSPKSTLAPRPVEGPDVTASRPSHATSLAANLPAWLFDAVQDTIARLQQLAPENVEPDAELKELGFDSVTYVELAERLNQRLGLELAPMVFFEHSTPLALVRFLASRHEQHLLARMSQAQRVESQAVSPSSPVMQSPLAASPAKSESLTGTPAKQVSVTDTSSSVSGEPIAVVGLSFAVPQASDPDSFWDLLVREQHAITEIPADRWDWQALWGDPQKESGKTNVKWGGFLNEVADFDSLFFGISPKEAVSMDPRQRLLLEHAWKAIEDAGISPDALHNSRTGVFIGTGCSEYGSLLERAAVEVEGYSNMGMVPSFGTSRVSYFLNLRGPSEPIETACSSSLVAIHRAMNAILQGECEQALAGGVNTIVTPDSHISFSKAGMLATDGRCKTYSDQADGYVRSEGVVVMLLKKRSAAERDGDPIYGLLRGSAVNHGGRSSALTAPNPAAQAELLVDAWRSTRRTGGLMSPRSLGVIETHGTGTSLGDPIEIEGLKRAWQEFAADASEATTRSQEASFDTSACGLSSVKTNIGHLELAAGAAGVVKVLLQFAHGLRVKNLFSETLNPLIQLENSPYFVVQESCPWPSPHDALGQPLPRCAGVSSFGLGGVNAHVVLEAYQSPVPELRPASMQPQLIVLSARTEKALKAQAERLSQHLKRHPDLALADIAHTLQVGRRAMEFRLALVALTVPGLLQQLERCARGESFVGWEGRAPSNTRPGQERELLTPISGIQTSASLEILAKAWTSGQPVAWRQLTQEPGARPSRRLHLPGYAFARVRHWPTLEGTIAHSSATSTPLPRTSSPVAQTEALPPSPESMAPLSSLRLNETPLRQVLATAQPETLLAFNRWLLRLTFLAFQKLGLFLPGVKELRAGLRQKAGILEKYARYCDEAVLLLEQFGFILLTPDTAERTPTAPGIESLERWWQRFEEACPHFQADPDLSVPTRLASDALRVLPEILTGKTLATEILFPRASMSKMEGLYKNSPTADAFNGMVADACVAYLQARLHAEPSARFRLLEIGAGTGGTSAVVLPRLNALQPHVAEYCYTDLSRAFLMHAERTYGPSAPYLRYKLLNISQPLVGQGLEPGQYDVVIAANVLHATPDIRVTLKHALSALKPGGLLLLNEMSHKTEFGSLIFGLLDGWWLYEDEALRIPASPGLLPETWQKVLLEEGCSQVHFPAAFAHGLGQQLILATAPTQPKVHMDATAPSTPTLPARPAPSIEASDKHPLSDVELKERLRPHVQALLKAELIQALQLPPDEVDPDGSFADYGVDSITGVELIDRLNERLSLSLKTTALFDFNSLRRLTDHLLDHQPQLLASRLLPKAAPAERSLKEAVLQAPASIEEPQRKPTTPAEGSPLPRTGHEPIAIIGMSGRFAQSPDLKHLWQHLAAGHDLVSPVTRWNLSDAGHEGICLHGSFLEDIASFDPLFFKISGMEALYTDPQQRLLLEEAYHALEDAGYAGNALQGKVCGIYVGCGNSDYMSIFEEDLPPQAFWGNANSITPARVAYCLDLQGPAITVDTACSSSLVATHLACQALWSGEVDVALSGGVFIQATAEFQWMATKAGMLSATGRCHTFDARADGFVPGEGVGVVVLKRLSDALAAGDHIHGVIYGSSINQDGTTNGITAPSARSQERLERTVYERFQLNPASFQLVEAHGTGTILGDPIEVEALSNAFRAYSTEAQSCALGSIKTNIGHTSTAAGVAGLLKVLLALRAQKLPPSLHYERTNPNIRLDEGPFYVNTQLTPWPEGPAWAPSRRLAAISSFGFSGTNAHLVVGEAPARPPSRQALAQARPAQLIVLSARSAEQLRTVVAALVEHLTDASGATRAETLDLGDVSHTLMLGRKHCPHRLAVVAENLQGLVERLSRWLSHGHHPDVLTAILPETGGKELSGLKRYGQECLNHARKTNERGLRLGLLGTLAELYVQGYALAWEQLFDETYGRTSLPTYPFARERYWPQTQAHTAASAADTAPDLAADTTLNTAHSFAAASESPVSAAPAHAGLPAHAGSPAHAGAPASAHETPLSRSATANPWLLLREEWKETPLPTDVPWQSLLEAQLDKSVLIVYEADEQRSRFERLLFQLASLCSSPRRLRVSSMHISRVAPDAFQQAPGVVFFVLDPRAMLAEAGLSAVHQVYMLAQSLMKACWDEPIQLYCLYTVPEPSSESSPESSASLTLQGLSGLLRSAMLECEQHVWKLIRVETPAFEVSAEQLVLREWLMQEPLQLGARGNREILYRGTLRAVKWLEEFALDEFALAEVAQEDGNQRAVDGTPGASTSAQPTHFRQGGTYLLTGALGYVGTQLCQWLARHRKAHLIVLSRRQESPEVLQWKASLEALGARVEYHSVDITDEAALTQTLANLRQTSGPVHGVFHLARSHEDQLLAMKPWESFARVIQTKVQATLLLDRLLATERLDFFVLAASLGAFGVRGSCDYAFATAFQGAFAQVRNQLVSRGLRHGKTVTHAWGPWKEDLLFPESRAKLAENGFQLLEVTDAVAAIEATLSANVPSLALAQVRERERVARRLGVKLLPETPVKRNPVQSASAAPGSMHQSPDKSPVETAAAVSSSEAHLLAWEARARRGEDVSIEISNTYTAKQLDELDAESLERLYRLLFAPTAPAQTVVQPKMTSTPSGNAHEHKIGPAPAPVAAYSNQSPATVKPTTVKPDAVMSAAVKPAVSKPATVLPHSNGAPPASTNGGEPLAEVIRRTFSELMQISQVDPNNDFQNYGMDSVAAMQLSTRLQKKLGRELPPSWLIDFPTVNRLAAHLTQVWSLKNGGLA